MAKIMTVYFSHSGENYFGGEIRSIEKGNTAIAAEMVQAAAGGELFEIETVKPYAAEYHTCVVEARDEMKAKARPAVKAYPQELENCDTIFVGYPNWCIEC